MALRELIARFDIGVFGAKKLTGAMASMKRAEVGARSLDRGLKGIVATVGRSLLPLLAGFGAARLFADGIGAAANFGEAISAVGAVGLETREQISELEQQALKLGETTVFSATQAANGMELMRKAGFDTADTMSGIQGVLNAAAAGGIGLAEASSVVSNVLKGMRLEADQATRVADVLALASSRTNSTIGSLGESMKNVGSTAAQLGLGLEGTVASVALLQDVGLDASVAGSAMNTMLTRLGKPADGVAAKLKEFGVAFKDAEGNALPLEGILANISLASERAGGNMDQVALISDLVGNRGAKAAVNLVKMFDDKRIKALTAELREGAGVAEAMAKLRLDNLSGDVKLLKSAWEGLNIAIFGASDGAQRSFIQNLTKIIQATTRWARESEGAKRVMSALRAAIPLAALKLIQLALSAIVKNYGVLIRFGRLLFRSVLPWIALGLAIDDVITFLRGGKSVIGDFIDEIFGIGAAEHIVTSIRATFRQFVNFVKGNKKTIIALAAAFGFVSLSTSVATKALAIYRGAAALAAGINAALGGTALGAAGGVMALVGAFVAALAAVTAVIAAVDQFLKLAKEVGGLGGIWDFVTGGFGAVDERLNEQARQRKVAKDAGKKFDEPLGSGGGFIDFEGVKQRLGIAKGIGPRLTDAERATAASPMVPFSQSQFAPKTDIQQDNRVNLTIQGDASPGAVEKVKGAVKSLQPTRSATLAAAGA